MRTNQYWLSKRKEKNGKIRSFYEKTMAEGGNKASFSFKDILGANEIQGDASNWMIETRKIEFKIGKERKRWDIWRNYNWARNTWKNIWNLPALFKQHKPWGSVSNTVLFIILQYSCSFSPSTFLGNNLPCLQPFKILFSKRELVLLLLSQFM